MNAYWLFLIIPASVVIGVVVAVYAIITVCNALTRREK